MLQVTVMWVELSMRMARHSQLWMDATHGTGDYLHKELSNQWMLHFSHSFCDNGMVGCTEIACLPGELTY